MSAAISPPRITSGDRLGVTLFVAMAIHSLLILGVSFNRQDRDNRNAPPLTMEITLVQSRQQDAPKDAAYLAQANQAGGGDVKENVRPSSPVASPHTRDEKGDAASDRLATSPRPRPVDQRKLITADPLHCQRTLARTIVEKGGDYLFQIKANHPNLLQKARGLDALPGTPFSPSPKPVTVASKSANSTPSPSNP